MSLLSLGLKAKRWQAVLIDATLGTALAAYALFVFDFSSCFISFLSLMVLWIAPWCGIYLADMAYAVALRRGALHEHSGRYWYRRASTLSRSAGLWRHRAGLVVRQQRDLQGPLVHLVGGGDISLFVGFLVSLVGYYLTMRDRVRLDGPLPRPMSRRRARRPGHGDVDMSACGRGSRLGRRPSAQAWFDVRPLAEGVFLIAEPGHVNNFLVVGDDRAVLLDTGLGVADIRTVAEGLAGKPLSVVNSHYHFDHSGGNRLRRHRHPSGRGRSWPRPRRRGSPRATWRTPGG